MSETVTVLGPGRIGRQIALTFALAGHHVVLVDLKDRSVADSELALADARREIARDVALMVEEQVVPEDEAARGLERIEERIGLGDLGACGSARRRCGARTRRDSSAPASRCCS